VSGAAPRVEILSQGDELVAGEVVDTNAAWLARELTALGHEVTRHTAVGDRLDALVELLREIAGRADGCVCSGGLGPTVDDLTAEAVARAFERPLVLDETALRGIRAWYERLGTPMPEPNRKQALLPEGARRLDNHHGTAPGFTLIEGGCRFYFLPGVPWEMRGMFEHGVKPDLAATLGIRPLRQITLRTIGVGESALQARMNAIALPEDAALGFCLVGSEVRIKLRFPADCADDRLRALAADLEQALGDAVFSIDGIGRPSGDLADVVGRLLSERRARLIVAETVSAGRLASQCAHWSGLAEARVYRDVESLRRALNLPVAADREALADHAARQLRLAAGADYGLVQIPSGTDDSELRVSLATPTGTLQAARSLGQEPNRRVYQAVGFTLDVLRRYLLTHPQKLAALRF
jgi:competence/damage-inducible protein CinA-like protein